MPQKSARTIPDSYFRLIKELPLTHIRDDAHLAAAIRMVDRLLETKLDSGMQQYLDVLTDLVEDYEDDNVAIPEVSESTVLRELMSSNKLSQAALAKQVGISQSTLSAVLVGTRSLTKAQVLALSKHFRVSPLAFLPR
jgi:antitoxin component HigA of HigAB toxin-antitoxin module